MAKRKPKPNTNFNRNPEGKGGFQPGNQLAKLGHHTRDPITQQLLVQLHQPPRDPEVKYVPLTRLEQMVSEMIDMACERNTWAIDYIYDRVEGKVTVNVAQHVSHTLEDALPYLSDEELQVMERAAKKVLTLTPTKIIDGQAR